jgi:hypothetical protein
MRCFFPATMIELGLEPRVHALLLPGHHDFGFSGAELWLLCAA